MKISSLVKMSKTLKKGLRKNDCSEHVDEFGHCVGVIELIDCGVATVKWLPSNLKYHYLVKDLIIV